MAEAGLGVEKDLLKFQVLDGAIALVTLARPEKRNAINAALARQLEAMVFQLEESEAVRAVVLTGEGQVFSAGADLKEVAAGGLDATFLPGSGFAGFVTQQRSKPWVCAVQGPALAGGLEIALACDVILASELAQFGLPEVTRGLIASAGGLYRLPRALPRTAAMEMILTGAAIGAEAALAMGLVSRVCPPDELLPAALSLARAIAANAPLAVTQSLRLARLASGFDDEALRADAERTQAELQRSADYHEGASAFVEKRLPVWRGA